MIATLVAFLDASNTGRVDAALALMAPDVVLNVTDPQHYAFRDAPPSPN